MAYTAPQAIGQVPFFSTPTQTSHPLLLKSNNSSFGTWNHQVTMRFASNSLTSSSTRTKIDDEGWSGSIVCRAAISRPI